MVKMKGKRVRKRKHYHAKMKGGGKTTSNLKINNLAQRGALYKRGKKD